jgi:hypothetical protein
VALDHIDGDRTAIERHSWVRLTTATSLNEARAHLRATGEPAAVVYRGNNPVGLVTAAKLSDQVTQGRRDVPLIAVMDYVAVPVDGYRDANEALRALHRSM